MTSIAETLNTAASVMEERGSKRGWWNMSGSREGLCVEGALQVAMGVTANSDEQMLEWQKSSVYTYLLQYLHVSSLWMWYDDVKPTPAKTADILRAAAVAYETDAADVLS